MYFLSFILTAGFSNQSANFQLILEIFCYFPTYGHPFIARGINSRAVSSWRSFKEANSGDYVFCGDWASTSISCCIS